MANGLTALGVKNLRAKERRFEVKDSKPAGLRLTILPSGVKVWSVRYRFAGRGRRLVIGRYPAIQLDTARKLANTALRTAAAGDDPQAKKIETRRRAQAGLDREELFGATWDRYIDEYVRPKLKPSSIYEIERIGKKLILPKFKRRKLMEIGPHDIKALMAAQKKRGAPVQANKVFITLRGFFNWCRRELLLQANPCTGLQKPEEEKARTRILSDQEIGWLWRACDQIGFPFGPMTKLLLLTAARRAEISGLSWNEVDMTARLIKLPGQRTKNGQPHAIHIADLAKGVIDPLPRLKADANLVFSTNGKKPVSGFSRAKARIDKLMAGYAKEEGKTVAPWVIHDLRRTAASGMARLGVALPVIERCLNHVSGSFGGIVGVYQHHQFEPEKKAAFEAWAAHVSKAAA